MKWKNRLEAVLTQNATSENSKECLKTQLRITAETPNSLVSAVINSDEFRHFPKNNDDLAEFKSKQFHTRLNHFIADGVTFEVSADEFQVLDSDEKLKISDKEFLQLNRQDILCELQQSLLVKHLFSHSPEQFEDFVFSVNERESLLSITDKTRFEIDVLALRQTTKIWFAELLEKK